MELCVSDLGSQHGEPKSWGISGSAQEAMQAALVLSWLAWLTQSIMCIFPAPSSVTGGWEPEICPVGVFTPRKSANAPKQSFSLDPLCNTPLPEPYPLQLWQRNLICFMCWVLGEILFEGGFFCFKKKVKNYCFGPICLIQSILV